MGALLAGHAQAEEVGVPGEFQGGGAEGPVDGVQDVPSGRGDVEAALELDHIGVGGGEFGKGGAGVFEAGIGDFAAAGHGVGLLHVGIGTNHEHA